MRYELAEKYGDLPVVEARIAKERLDLIDSMLDYHTDRLREERMEEYARQWREVGTS